ncbi:hypothetical protein KI387_021109, partial [Taxus chinensis]
LDEDDRFVMHSELRDTGRAIVAEESVDPGKRSRLWKTEEAELVIMEGKGTENLKCLTYLQQDVTLETRHLQRMCNLQLLWLDGAFIEGDFGEMPPNLKWLRWENCPLKCLPSEWIMKHLVVLDLSFGKDIEALWPELSNIEVAVLYRSTLESFHHWKFCTLSYKISCLPPTFSTLLQLNKLYLHHCTEFVELPHLPKELIEVCIQECLGLKKISDMSHLKRLKLLRIHNCRELVELPDFGSLQSLQELSISECRNVKRIEGVEGLKSLRRLHVTGCRLVSSGSSILKPRQLIKETRCLELFSFSANGVPECLEKKIETDGHDFLYVTLDSNEQCSGLVLCFMARFKSGISSVGIELSTSRNGKEIFNTRLVNHSKYVEGDQIFVHIWRKNHPVVMMVQIGDVVRAKADRDDERMLIRSGGMQFFFEGEDRKREDLILESLGKGLTVLLEDYNENLAFEAE